MAIPALAPVEVPPHAAKTLNRRRANKLRRRNTLLGWSFIAPNFIGFALITMVPIVMLFYMAFTNWTALTPPEWTGLDNFHRLLRNTTFRASVAQTFYYAIPHIILTGVVSLALALLLNRKLKAVAFFRAAAFFPYITSIVAIAIVWNLLFSQQYGPINQILRFFGVDNPPGWTISSTWAMPAVIIVGTWREMGYYMLLFLAGLQTIPHELYEAARVDGAGGWGRFLHITWPSLRPTTFFVTVMLAISSFKIFDLIQVMTNGGPGTSTYTISFFIFQRTLAPNQSTGEFGYASAASLVLFFICLACTILQFIVNQQTDLVKPKWTPLPLFAGLLCFALAIVSFCTTRRLLIGWGGWIILFIVFFIVVIVHTQILKRSQQ